MGSACSAFIDSPFLPSSNREPRRASHIALHPSKQVSRQSLKECTLQFPAASIKVTWSLEAM